MHMTHDKKPKRSLALRALLGASFGLGTLACAHAEADTESLGTAQQSITAVAKSYAAVGVGTMHTCGLTTTGALSCFGANGNKQAESPTGTYLALSTSTYGNCAIRADKSILCWGEDGTYETPPSGTFSAVARNEYHSCALKTD